ncbi:hypothetical protein V8G54_011173 [Vigna mungo]|uniref:Disease resistance RPP13-like protein 1 n=1 Tax=Vigna mungo TaxID=3915 RepID=A0AAQ3S0Y9_VIGMU
MAAELVGGALLSAFLQVAFDRLASPQFVDFFRGRKLDEKLLGNLNIMLHSMNALAHDAEQKQFTDPHVKAWLFSVKEAVFDAEDLLAEIDYELTRCQVEAESEPQTFTHKVSNFFNSSFNSFNKKIESEMKELLEKLEYLSKQKGALGLKEGTYSGDRSGDKMSQKLPSSSLMVESVIYGRDADKEMIFNWLTSETNNQNLSILSIVGMGGLGKTTLAQHVYNDQKIETKFDIRAWVCVSDHFDILAVTKTILEAITKSKDDSGNLEMVHGRLKEKVSGKKFLLILDDVWSERREEWEAVQTPLSYGAPGSRILVTTRIEKVASNMRSKVHRLKQLEEDECWKVFEDQALKGDDIELNDEKKEIGRRIVEKCKGLPLALKTIGSLLCTKSSLSDWKSVLKSDIWDLPKEVEIIPALLLSYQHLPSNLKRCFAYCALFPKNYEFDKDELILLWMAEGFLHYSPQNNNLEEIGEQYFDDLLMRSFFLRSNIKMHFSMHDLLNDLAKYVSAEFCFRLNFDKGDCVPKTTRHFSYALSDLNSCDVKYFDGLGSLRDAKRLRSFLPIVSNYGDGLFSRFEILIREFFKLKFLRVLSLNGYHHFKEVPDSVGDLKHLHSLDLSYTWIQKLPDSVGLLYNLLILKLNGCFYLKELPSSLHNLTKLRCLEFEDTEVTKMPMHFKQVKNLHVLNMFCVSRNSEFSIKQLGGINLHKRLSINELQNIENPLDALEANLKKKQLVRLKLIWNLNHIPDDPMKEKKVLENLQPSNQLEHLSIRSYCGTQFPSWVFDNSLSNLVSLELEDCKYCLYLPPLGLLSSLKSLEIKGLDGIVSIGAEFYGSNSSSFKSLEILRFFYMKEWEEWECKTTSFPCLRRLFVVQCPKLKGLSEQLLHLEQLYIESCPNLIISEHIEDTLTLELLTIIRGCYSLTIFQLNFFPMLRFLHLQGCQNLQRISQHPHNHLETMSICACPQFESFPGEGLSVAFPSLTELRIINCPKVEKFPDVGLPSNVKHLSLSSLKLITSLREILNVNTCLEMLYIDSLDVECFPDEVLLPPSLTSLRISNCRNLKKLDYKLLYNLSSLTLSECRNLQFLPEEGLPKSISFLDIWDCPLLEQRCQKPEGKDWRKIAHIENLGVGS